MDDAKKTKAQLLQEIAVLRQRLAQREAAPPGRNEAGQERLLQVEQEHDALSLAVEERTQALATSEAQLRAIWETVVDGIITMDARGRIESVNPAAEHLFGYPAADLVGQNVSVLLPASYRQEHDGQLARYLQMDEQRIIGVGPEVVGQRQNGTTFPRDLATGEVRLSDQRLFTGIVRDFSERKRMEAAMRRMEQLVLMGRPAASVSHELRDPLNTIFL